MQKKLLIILSVCFFGQLISMNSDKKRKVAIAADQKEESKIDDFFVPEDPDETNIRRITEALEYQVYLECCDSQEVFSDLSLSEESEEIFKPEMINQILYTYGKKIVIENEKPRLQKSNPYSASILRRANAMEARVGIALLRKLKLTNVADKSVLTRLEKFIKTNVLPIEQTKLKISKITP